MQEERNAFISKIIRRIHRTYLIFLLFSAQPPTCGGGTGLLFSRRGKPIRLLTNWSTKLNIIKNCAKTGKDWKVIFVVSLSD